MVVCPRLARRSRLLPRAPDVCAFPPPGAGCAASSRSLLVGAAFRASRPRGVAWRPLPRSALRRAFEDFSTLRLLVEGLERTPRAPWTATRPRQARRRSPGRSPWFRPRGRAVTGESFPPPFSTGRAIELGTAYSTLVSPAGARAEIRSHARLLHAGALHLASRAWPSGQPFYPPSFCLPFFSFLHLFFYFSPCSFDARAWHRRLAVRSSRVDPVAVTLPRTSSRRALLVWPLGPALSAPPAEMGGPRPRCGCPHGRTLTLHFLSPRPPPPLPSRRVVSCGHPGAEAAPHPRGALLAPGAAPPARGRRGFECLVPRCLVHPRPTRRPRTSSIALSSSPPPAPHPHLLRASLSDAESSATLPLHRARTPFFVGAAH